MNYLSEQIMRKDFVRFGVFGALLNLCLSGFRQGLLLAILSSIPLIAVIERQGTKSYVLYVTIFFCIGFAIGLFGKLLDVKSIEFVPKGLNIHGRGSESGFIPFRCITELKIEDLGRGFDLWRLRSTNTNLRNELIFVFKHSDTLTRHADRLRAILDDNANSASDSKPQE